ncbi:hypothetical protein [Ramlibacter sp. PS4R-6]|uniref:hypothetical protein n=1 Tax=Ramlibacter sp. PS4R-6 TaxID=3133438 RepID=UPI0030A77C6C
MREAIRCLAWAFALGAGALAFALFAGAGLEHSDGPFAWLLVVVYAPYYALVHVFGDRGEWPFRIAVFVAQAVWFFALVALVRRAAHGKPRWRSRGAAE